MYRNSHLTSLEQIGVYFPDARDFLPPEWKRDCTPAFRMAMDAQPTLISTPNAALPVVLTTWIDPNLVRVLTAPLKATQIFREERKGDWTQQTVMFPVVERTGVTSSYGDHSQNGAAGINTNFVQRQVYNYQTFIEYGDLELERWGLAKLNYAAELKESAVWALNNYQNLSYFYGVSGLQVYGLLNDPSLPPPIASSLKAYGNNRWITGNTVTAAALEIYADIISLFQQLVKQSAGNIDHDSELILGLSPSSSVALAQIVQFGISVLDMLKKEFSRLTVVTAVQYGVASTANNQGSQVGEVVQLIARSVQGQESGVCAFAEKLRAFPIVRKESSFRQKLMQSTEGVILRLPFAVAQMIGV